MRLIDADKLIYSEYTNMFDEQIVFDTVTKARVDSMPTIKAIPIELYKQVKGERDVAIEQLKSLNIELFEKPYHKAIPIKYIEAFKKEFRAVASVKWVIEWLLEKWEKESEQNKESTSQSD